MVFSSQIFLFIFLPITLLGYYVLRPELRDIFLLLASFLFYAWAGPRLLFVLIISIMINYLFGLLIQSIDQNRQNLRQALIIFALTLNLALLGYFKYFNFFIGIINNITHLNFSQKEIALPLGISFFTFSGISYILDIDSGKIKADKNLLHFALFMAFFPKLLQGPISRYEDIKPAISDRKNTVYQFSDGTSRFIVGMAKKVLIADQLSNMVSQIYSTPALNNSISVAWLGAIGYTLQIYFDFSGYSDMAIGLGKFFGFEFPENFNYPYISTSITEFWRRWHITLGSWFRDYVFYPLEFKRRKVKKFRVETNTLITFFLTGLWHGASWNFIFWGLWHGIVIAFENFSKSKHFSSKIPVCIKWLITFLIVIIGWVIFRSPDLTYAYQYLQVMFGISRSISPIMSLTGFLNMKIVTIIIVGSIICIPWGTIFTNFIQKYNNTNIQAILKFIKLGVLLIISMIYLISSSYNAFIYFKF